MNLAVNRALEIVQIAKTDRPRAEQLALKLIQEVNPNLGARSVSISESKLSLNSVNGSIEADKKYFFKFHAEEGEMEGLKSVEYYNARLLADAGWPVVQPVFTSATPGSQFVVYDYLEAPTAFALYEKAEESGSGADELLAAERELAAKIGAAYLASLQESPRAEIESASLNQLFFKRLVSDNARLGRYYLGKIITLQSGTISFDQLAKLKWVVNGIRYEKTLGEIIESAKDLLNPAKEQSAATVVGHGDDHNGNRFLIDGDFKFFDAAFAGRQPALLSYIKATAHNVFVHPRWLYDPKKLEGKLQLKISLADGIITVEHNWDLTRIREQILAIYANEIWQPLITELSKRGWLPAYWREYMRAALFCCPFLVLNLIDSKKYAPEQSILALSKCVELGSQSDADTMLDKFFRDIAPRV